MISRVEVRFDIACGEPKYWNLQIRPHQAYESFFDFSQWNFQTSKIIYKWIAAKIIKGNRELLWNRSLNVKNLLYRLFVIYEPVPYLYHCDKQRYSHNAEISTSNLRFHYHWKPRRWSLDLSWSFAILSLYKFSVNIETGHNFQKINFPYLELCKHQQKVYTSRVYKLV